MDGKTKAKDGRQISQVENSEIESADYSNHCSLLLAVKLRLTTMLTKHTGMVSI